MRRLPLLLSTSVAVAAVGAALTLQAVAGGPSAEADTTTADTSGCTDVDGYTVCLTDPTQYDDDTDTTIVDELERQVQATESGDTVRIAIYEWNLEPLAHHLVEAQDRGVDVQVVIGQNRQDPDRNDAVIAILRDGDIPVEQCENACLPNGDGVHAGVNHNKFFLFDTAESAKVMQTSSNITLGQTQVPQNMLVLHDDPDLFEYYTEYWDRMNAGSWDGWGHEDKAADGSHDHSKAYVFPRASGDIVSEVLDNVDECREGNDKVWVAHSLFAPERQAVRDKLVQLQDDLGCDVRVVVNQAEDAEWISGPIPADKVRVSPNHNKLITLDANYAGQWREVVFAGSHNLTSNSLRNANDTMLRLIHPEVAGIYTDYVEALYDNA